NPASSFPSQMFVNAKRLLMSLVFFLGLTSGVFAAKETVFERTLPGYSKALQERADLALENIFEFQGLKDNPSLETENSYDWDHGGPKNDKEWAWFLNRHRYFEDLYVAFQKTGDSRYKEKLFQILGDWLDKYADAPSNMNFSSAWRPLEAARRVLESWDIVYLKLGSDPNFDSSLKSTFLASLENHGDYLQNHHALFGNHLITEMIALLKVSLLLPEAKNSLQWQDYALSKLNEEYDKQVYPEGAHKELSSHYQRVVALNYEKLLSLLKISGKAELIEIWTPKVNRLWDYFSAIRKPNGYAPLNNDSDRENVSSLLMRNGRNSSQSVGSFYFPNAGQVILRSDAAEETNLWSFFDIGPRGSDHQHEDFMHVSLSFADLHVLVDNGRYTYQPGKWRDYFQGPRSHNVLMIDGLQTKPKPNVAKGPLYGTGFAKGSNYEAAWGSASFHNTIGERTTDWQRIVIRVPGDNLLIIDHLITFKERLIEGYWHSAPLVDWTLHPDHISAEKNANSSKITYANSGTKSLDRSLQIGVDAQTVAGWHSPRFNLKKPAYSLHYQTTISKPTVFAWLFSHQDNLSEIETIELDQQEFRLAYHLGGSKFEISGNLPKQSEKLTLTIRKKN
ncbi:MAG: alginate lyase family protein, partial [Verrucomicrobiota bacterium]